MEVYAGNGGETMWKRQWRRLQIFIMIGLVSSCSASDNASVGSTLLTTRFPASSSPSLVQDRAPTATATTRFPASSSPSLVDAFTSPSALLRSQDQAPTATATTRFPAFSPASLVGAFVSSSALIQSQVLTPTATAKAMIFPTVSKPLLSTPSRSQTSTVTDFLDVPISSDVSLASTMSTTLHLADQDTTVKVYSSSQISTRIYPIYSSRIQISPSPVTSTPVITSMPPTSSLPTTSTPTTARTVPSRYLELKLSVSPDRFNDTLFLQQFRKYIAFQPDEVVIEPVPGSDNILRVYLPHDITKNDAFIDNFEEVWNNVVTRNMVFGSTITNQIIGFEIVTDETSDGLPSWGIALVVMFLLLACAAVFFFIFVFKRSNKKARRPQGKRGGVAPSNSFHMHRVPRKESTDQKNVRRFINRMESDPRLQVQTRRLDVVGLGKALEKEEELISEYQSIPPMMASGEDIPRENQSKNRYNNVLPSPHTRVPLFLRFGQPNSDYINANYVKGYNNSVKTYIATQGPMESTIDDFWRMVWEQHSSVILMVTGLLEREVPKCAQYWPDGEEQKNLFYGELEVMFISSEVKGNFVQTVFSLSHMEKQEERQVTHYWFTAWPDFGVPEDPSDLTSYIEAANKNMAKSEGPIIVHCSAGIGRTGVLIAAHIGMQDLEASKHCDVLQTVSLMRQDRGGSVQTKDQYIFIYMVLYAYATYLESLDKLNQGPTEPIVGATPSSSTFQGDSHRLLSDSSATSDVKDHPITTAAQNTEVTEEQIPASVPGEGKSRESTPLSEGRQNSSQATRTDTTDIKGADTSVWL